MGLRANRNRPDTPIYLLRHPADHNLTAYSRPKNTTSTISYANGWGEGEEVRVRGGPSRVDGGEGRGESKRKGKGNGEGEGEEVRVRGGPSRVDGGEGGGESKGKGKGEGEGEGGVRGGPSRVDGGEGGGESKGKGKGEGEGEVRVG